MTHTKTPWEFKEGHYNNSMVYGENGKLVAVFQDDDKANAEFIVTACNSHYNLLEACKEADAGLHEALGDLTDHFTIKHVKGYIETVEQAIQKAEGK